jgi:hypothetical protein
VGQRVGDFELELGKTVEAQEDIFRDDSLTKPLGQCCSTKQEQA